MTELDREGGTRPTCAFLARLLIAACISVPAATQDVRVLKLLDCGSPTEPTLEVRALTDPGSGFDIEAEFSRSRNGAPALLYVDPLPRPCFNNPLGGTSGLSAWSGTRAIPDLFPIRLAADTVRYFSLIGDSMSLQAQFPRLPGTGPSAIARSPTYFVRRCYFEAKPAANLRWPVSGEKLALGELGVPIQGITWIGGPLPEDPTYQKTVPIDISAQSITPLQRFETPAGSPVYYQIGDGGAAIPFDSFRLAPEARRTIVRLADLVSAEFGDLGYSLRINSAIRDAIAGDTMHATARSVDVAICDSEGRDVAGGQTGESRWYAELAGLARVAGATWVYNEKDRNHVHMTVHTGGPELEVVSARLEQGTVSVEVDAHYRSSPGAAGGVSEIIIVPTPPDDTAAPQDWLGSAAMVTFSQEDADGQYPASVRDVFEAPVFPEYVVDGKCQVHVFARDAFGSFRLTAQARADPPTGAVPLAISRIAESRSLEAHYTMGEPVRHRLLWGEVYWEESPNGSVFVYSWSIPSGMEVENGVLTLSSKPTDLSTASEALQEEYGSDGWLQTFDYIVEVLHFPAWGHFALPPKFVCVAQTGGSIAPDPDLNNTGFFGSTIVARYSYATVTGSNEPLTVSIGDVKVYDTRPGQY